MHVENLHIFLSLATYCPPLPAGPASNQDPSVPWGGIVRQVEQGSLHTGTCLGLNSRDFETPKSCTKVGVRVHSEQFPIIGPSGSQRNMEMDFLIRYLRYLACENNGQYLSNNSVLQQISKYHI